MLVIKTNLYYDAWSEKHQITILRRYRLTYLDQSDFSYIVFYSKTTYIFSQ
jgi:hypothetical protein